MTSILYIPTGELVLFKSPIIGLTTTVEQTHLYSFCNNNLLQMFVRQKWSHEFYRRNNIDSDFFCIEMFEVIRHRQYEK